MINRVPDEHKNESRLNPNTVSKENKYCQLTREDKVGFKYPIHDVLVGIATVNTT